MRLVVPGSTSRGVVGGQRGHFSTGWFACDTRASLCVIDSPKNISWAVSKLVSLSTSLNFVAFTSFGTLQRQPAPYSPNRREGSFSETHRSKVSPFTLAYTPVQGCMGVYRPLQRGVW